MGMKSRVICLGLLASFLMGCASTQPAARAAGAQTEYDPAARDILIEAAVRPLSLATTVAGTGLYVFTWPFAAASGSTKVTGKELVVKPWRATFNRPMGNFEKLEEINNE